jgi:DNA polymerase-1
MIAVDAWLRESKGSARMIMQVHDELVIEVPEAEAAEARDKLVDIMSAAASLRVPLQVDAGIGSNWDEAH